MKTFNRILGLSLAAVALFASCTKETHTYEPGKPANSAKHDVYFAASNDATVVLSPSATSFTVTLERSSDNLDAIEVPVESWVSAEGLLEVPSKISFASGAATAELEVKVLDGLEMFTNYQANIKLAEEYTNPYLDNKNYPQYGFIFYKEDYEVIGVGEYYAPFLFGTSWDQPIEYSEMLDQYRLSDVWTVGSGFTFKWDGESSKVTLPSAGIATGVYHPDYGYITATPVAAQTAYVAKYNAIQFMFTWTVSAGSFGDKPNILYLP